MNLYTTNDTDDTVEIEGVIAPYELNVAHRAGSLMIFGEGEHDFRIVQDHKGNELRSFLNHLVRVKGSIYKKNGEQFITIIEYKIIHHF